MDKILITGNTYPVKDAIKALGGRWNRTAQGWEVPPAQAEAAQALVDGAGPARVRFDHTRRRRTGRGRSRYGSNYARFEVAEMDGYDGSGGRESFTNKAGRCEDAPCCGCCS